MSEIDWEKRVASAFPWTDEHGYSAHRVAALRLIREAADARAEEIAKQIMAGVEGEGHCACWDTAAAIARSFISKPKTREQVLEEALQKIALRRRLDPGEAQIGLSDIAAAALEWKPD